MNRRVRVDYKKLKEVVSKLQQQRVSDDEESAFVFLTTGERVIGRGSPESFSTWNEQHREVICDLINEEIVIRELPSKPHSRVESYISAHFHGQAGPFGAPILTISTNEDLPSGNTILTPDVSVGVIGTSTRDGIRNYPVIVIEVGWTQSPAELHGRAAMFVGGARYPTVEYYVALLCYDYDPTMNGSQGMVAAVYTRANPAVPVSVTSFGTGRLNPRSFWADPARNFPAVQGVGVAGAPPCNALGIADYVLQFPPAVVFGSRVGGVPGGILQPYTLDLHAVQVYYLQE